MSAPAEKKTEAPVKAPAVTNSPIPSPQPIQQMEFRTYSAAPMQVPLLHADNKVVPAQKEPVATTTAPTVVTTFQRIEGGVRPALAPVPTMAAPPPMVVPSVMQVTPIPTVAPSTEVRPVVMQQPAVLPGLPPVGETTTSSKVQAPVTLPGLPAETPAVPRVFQPTPTPVASEQPPATDDSKSETLADYNIEVKPPTLDRLYRVESEATLKKRLVDEMAKRPARDTNVIFPVYKPLTDEQYQQRHMGGLIKQIEPQYLVHGRLYCEELNGERYGWDLGVIHPFVSGAVALKDFALFPYNFATRPYQRFDASSGKCFPGDPVPFLLYPPEISIPGSALEAGVFLAAFAIVP